MERSSTHPQRNLFFADMHHRVEDERVFVFGDKLLVLAAVRPSHVLQLDAVELRRAGARASVDGELSLGAVADLAHAVDVLAAVGNVALGEQRQFDRRQVVLQAHAAAAQDPGHRIITSRY